MAILEFSGGLFFLRCGWPKERTAIGSGLVGTIINIVLTSLMAYGLPRDG
ncbi:hypothetical protein [Paenibacillus spongiae]|uniref:Uncharacterized protein n=1 Tax=Paenibacillus spongiae TaxID=2909671 RepID=A0ABY5SCT2_9BACL|nr:hypothetical protein [Paenibacillus spongiae]UVI30103.1 hypothetical protein L1F29_32825 [Paenibacillus spongiae]